MQMLTFVAVLLLMSSTASAGTFWSELPSRLGSVALLDESDSIDAQGNLIPTDVLNAAGFTRDSTTGQWYVAKPDINKQSKEALDRLWR